jgi:predicted small integral membrane protein
MAVKDRGWFDWLALALAVALFLGAILPLLAPLLVTEGRGNSPAEPGRSQLES